MRLHGKERHAHTVLAARRQREAQLAAFPHEELVRNLDQDAGAVAGFRIAAACSAVRQVDQKLYALDDDLVGLLTLDIGDEADATRIAFVGGVIETLRRGQAIWDNRVVHENSGELHRTEGSPVAAWFAQMGRSP